MGVTTLSQNAAMAAVSPLWIFTIGSMALVLLFALLFLVTRYRRCAPNEILVVFGRLGPHKNVKCLHGGGTFVQPLIQDCARLSLKPVPLAVELDGVPCTDGGRVSMSMRGQVAISTDPMMMRSAAERLLGLTPEQVAELARDAAETTAIGVVQRTAAADAAHDRHGFRKAIREAVEESIGQFGLVIATFEVTHLTIQQPEAAALGTSASGRTA